MCTQNKIFTFQLQSIVYSRLHMKLRWESTPPSLNLPEEEPSHSDATNPSLSTSSSFFHVACVTLRRTKGPHTAILRGLSPISYLLKTVL